jgi:S-adenosylmethionine decarboxylase
MFKSLNVLNKLYYIILMFSNVDSTPGKQLILDIKNIKNTELLNNLNELTNLLDIICSEYNYTILNKLIHKFEPVGFSIIYMLSESHLTIHTFPEQNYIAFDLYTCRNYKDNSIYENIIKYLTNIFDSNYSYNIIDRKF